MYMCLAALCTSPVVLCLPGIEFQFTYWGIASGLIWNASMIPANIAVGLVGISLAQGVWYGLLPSPAPSADVCTTTFAAHDSSACSARPLPRPPPTVGGPSVFSGLERPSVRNVFVRARA